MFARLAGLLGGERTDRHDERRRIEVAVAVVLLEMAHADRNLADLEKQLIENLLQRKFQLDDAQVTELLELAEDVRRDSADLQQFTSRINEGFSREEKFQVMETLWRIIYADGVLNRYEDAMARQLAALLRLSHREAIDLKVKVLDELKPDR